MKANRIVIRLPPGPTGLPFLGVVKQLDPTKAVQTILKWKEQYGDIFSFTLPAQYVVVVSIVCFFLRLCDSSMRQRQWFKKAKSRTQDLVHGRTVQTKVVIFELSLQNNTEKEIEMWF